MKPTLMPPAAGCHHPPTPQRVLVAADMGSARACSMIFWKNTCVSDQRGIQKTWPQHRQMNVLWLGLVGMFAAFGIITFAIFESRHVIKKGSATRHDSHGRSYDLRHDASFLVARLTHRHLAPSRW
jgi:hypothetical protein